MSTLYIPNTIYSLVLYNVDIEFLDLNQSKNLRILKITDCNYLKTFDSSKL